MSLSKSQSVVSNSRRDSYTHRFNNNLSENILNYLPLKDKFRFECLSKQFQRTVFKRHYRLNIDYFVNYMINENLVTIIGKKLSNIRSVMSTHTLTDQLFYWFCKYCKNLIKIDCNWISLSDPMFTTFSQTYGSKLISISLNSIDIRLIGKSFVNIREIECKTKLLAKHLDYISSVRFKNLKKFSFSFDINSIKEISQSMRKLFEYNKNITHLSIDYYSGIKLPIGFLFLDKRYRGKNQNTNVSDFETNFQVISQLSQLVSLRVTSFFQINSLIIYLKPLALNCRKLKSLNITNCLLGEESQIIEVMTQLKRFNELKRLEIDFKSDGYSKDIEYYVNKSLNSGFEELTHLCIGFIEDHTKFREGYDFEDTVLANIVRYLPKLQELNFKNNIKATEHTAVILSRLSNLETLKLNFTDKSVIDLFKIKIREKCRKIKSMEIMDSKRYICYDVYYSTNE